MAKKRANRFPLHLHKSGQYRKIIAGKAYYFGTDREQALQRYIREAPALYSGQGRNPVPTPADNTSIKTLCNLYLAHQDAQVSIGHIKYAHMYGLQRRLRAFASHVGPDTLVCSITTMTIQQYRAKLIGDGLAPNTINNHLRSIKALFNWALENEVIQTAPKLKAVKVVKVKRADRQTFTPDEIKRLLDMAGVQLKAMILLGLNCGFGCSDCADLRWENIDLANGRISYPRTKTGVERNFPLWPATVEALNRVPRRGDRVFITNHGNPWLRKTKGSSVTNPISIEFCKLLRKAGIQAQAGTGFYTLRRTAATLAAETGDVFAVKGLLGHADLTMASTYVQQGQLTAQTDKAIRHTADRLDLTGPGNPGQQPSSSRDGEPAQLTEPGDGPETHQATDA
jgi:integrase